MSKYYYLIAGLPEVALDDGRRPYTVADFKAEVMPMLSATDRPLFSCFFLQYDNRNVLSMLQHAETAWDARGTVTRDDAEAVLTALKTEEALPRTSLPAYLVDFMREYLQVAEEGREMDAVVWQDRLSARYFRYAMGSKNAFVSAWYELNLNMANVLTAITCRKHGLDRAEYVVPGNETAKLLRTSNARDFGLGESLDYLPELMRVAEETDLLMRERRLDVMKWNWLEEETFFRTFDFESVFAYLLRLEMLERWATLDAAAGEKTFRSMVGALKKGSAAVLDEFKRNHTK